MLNRVLIIFKLYLLNNSCITLWTYIYIYIYVCVCVCVCVQTNTNTQRFVRTTSDHFNKKQHFLDDVQYNAIKVVNFDTSAAHIFKSGRQTAQFVMLNSWCL
jgi:hypothetical protein